MNRNESILLVTALLMSTSVLADEHKHLKLEIDIDSSDEDLSTFRFDSGQAGFDLHQMQVGESQTFTDESGNPALVTRTEDGFEFDVGGRKFDVEDYSARHRITHSENIEEHDGDVRIIKKVRKIDVSEEGGEVSVIDKHSSHDDVILHSDEEHEVYIIKKDVDATN